MLPTGRPDVFFGWKAACWPDQCAEILANRIPWPISLTVYPTNRCNRECPWCIMRAERASGAELSPEVWHRLLALPVKSLWVTGGGEPTLYPHLAEVTRFDGTRILDTNGVALTPDIARRFHRVRISLNAGTPDGYAQSMGVAPSEETELEFGTITVNAAAVASLQPDLSLGLAMVGDRQNAAEVEAFVQLADAIGAAWVHIRPAYYPPGPEAERVHAHWETIAMAALGTGMQSRCVVYCTAANFAGYWGARAFAKCRATPLQAVVTADGMLSLCKDRHVKFGDLNRQEFAEVWGSAEHREAIAGVDLDGCPRCVMTRHNEWLEAMAAGAVWPEVI